MSRDEPGRATQDPTTAGGTAWIALGSALNGLAAFGFQLVGTRALGPADYAPIGVVWTLQYLWIAVAVTAVEAYVTRLATVEGANGVELRRFLRLFTPWLLVVTIVTVGIGWALRESLFGGVADLAVVLGILVLGYGWYGAVRGRAAGTGQYPTYALATAAESILRLVAAIAVLSMVATSRSLAWVFPVGPLVVVAAIWPRWRREVGRSSRDPSPTEPDGERRRRVGTRFLVATSTANASVQFLLAGGPLVLLPLGADAVMVSVFFTTITAARVPMTFALNGGLSRLLPPLTRLAQADDAVGLRHASRRLVALIVVTGTVAGIGASVLGPGVIALLFGEGFRPGRLFVTIVTVGTVLAVGGLLLDQVYIATGREARLPVTWLSAVALAALMVVILPGAPDLRVAGAFAGATAVAVAALGVPLISSRTRAT